MDWNNLPDNDQTIQRNETVIACINLGYMFVLLFYITLQKSVSHFLEKIKVI